MRYPTWLVIPSNPIRLDDALGLGQKLFRPSPEAADREPKANNGVRKPRPIPAWGVRWH